jgi:hypothetical protein
MLEIFCDRCAKKLKRPGGLVLSPPDKNNLVEKLHLCIRCFQDLMIWLHE